MKKLLLLALSLAWCSLTQAQQNVVLQFNHLIESEPLEIGTGKVYNTLNGIYNFSRLQYYISSIELVHDGGQVMPLTGTYLLVDGNTAAYNLGAYNVTNIEEIRFDVGVDQATNHLDPTTYAASHPLAPQVPSMHWGWTAGYKFWAIGGEADGTSAGVPNTTMEFHAIGDQYLKDIDLGVQNATVTNGNTTTIHVDADYNRLFVGVNMATIHHGQGGPMDRLMNNVTVYNVFSAANVTTIHKLPATLELKATPNPATVKTQILYHFDTPELLRLVVTDQLGKQVKVIDNLAHKGNVELSTEAWQAGMYQYSFFANKQLIATRKLLVN